MIHKGGCHCGAVRFEVEAPAEIQASECNCSICSKSGYLHLIVPRPAFKLLSGQENLQTYRFNTGVAKHLFCKTCGIKSFYVPRSHPEGISVNVRCLDNSTIRSVHIEPFDGAHWEESIQKLKASHES
ncbi:MAG: GFA family protein [Gammaproteobacteria bacterium]|nr:MAG: GFA family protein [Gammaproteobacteria bacterium]